MGYAVSWLAVRGPPASAVHDVLGVQGTSRFEELPELPIVGTVLPGGWVLVVVDGRGEAALELVAPEVVARLPGEVVVCHVQEHAMYSVAEGWRDGSQRWSIVHDSAQAIDHLDATGDLPAVYADIRRRQLTAQAADGGASAGVDHVFDVPVEVARALTAFRHDEDPPGVDAPAFEELIRPTSGGGGARRRRPGRRSSGGLA